MAAPPGAGKRARLWLLKVIGRIYEEARK